MSDFSEKSIPAGSGIKKYTFTQTEDKDDQLFYIYSEDGFNGTIANISVKEVLPKKLIVRSIMVNGHYVKQN